MIYTNGTSLISSRKNTSCSKLQKLFANGHSQAVRLPKEFRFAGDEVFIKQAGGMVVLIPYHEPWESLFDSLDQFSDDFMESRNQPTDQQHRDEVFD